MEREKSTLAAASAAAISVVLGDCDLLAEIFLRLGLPTDLVRAAAVCRRWLRAASDPAFLRRFRDAHPPRLLGFYLTTFSTDQMFRAEFVPMLPQPPELAAIMDSSSVMDSRDCRVVVTLFRDGDFTCGVHSPLHRARGFVTLPRFPAMDDKKLYIFRKILSRECGHGGLSYFWFELDHCSKEEKVTARVYKLQDDAWSMQTSAATQISRYLSSMLSARSAFLVDDKIYMGFTVHNILVLDLTSSTFSTMKYPERMAERFNGVIMLARADGSGVCLVHVDVDEIQLHVWLHSGCDGSAGNWMLVHTISLCDLYANLKISNSTTDVKIHAVGDNGEFVFLQMYGCVLYLDVRSSAMQKVYGVTDRDARIHPFLMAWPPVFPVLKE